MSGSVYQTLNLQTVHFAAHFLPTGTQQGRNFPGEPHTEINPNYAFTAHW